GGGEWHVWALGCELALWAGGRRGRSPWGGRGLCDGARAKVFDRRHPDYGAYPAAALWGVPRGRAPGGIGGAGRGGDGPDDEPPLARHLRQPNPPAQAQLLERVWLLAQR
nr:hypothetical protein [Tanacetum cinerariifolium]